GCLKKEQMVVSAIASTPHPYVRPERREIQLIKRLQQFVPDALPVVRKASWHCRQCHHDYYGEQYCTHCQTGGFSIPRTTQEEICEF
ncbi:hypothetical protein UL79_21760, partial [Shigella dysenteriae]